MGVPYSPNNGYVKEGRNEMIYKDFFVPDGVQGPDCADFPIGLASVPVVWNYCGKEINLEFHAGFVGATQEQSTGVIKPFVGWFIDHDGEAGLCCVRKHIL